jgi:hypothetical protein
MRALSPRSGPLRRSGFSGRSVRFLQMAQLHGKTDFAELQAIAVFHSTQLSGSTGVRGAG